MKIEDIFEYLIGGVTKPAQTRIKTVLRGDGTIVFIPQHRLWGIWRNFKDYEGKSIVRHTNPWCHSFFEHTEDIQKAKREIDNYLLDFKNNTAERKKEKLRKQEKEVRYIQYP